MNLSNISIPKFAVQLMGKNCYMAPEHRKYLRFMWGGKLFQYTCLPIGLPSAPRCFTKLLKPVHDTLRSQCHLNVGYIDDSYLQGSSVSDCSQYIWATICLFENLGFVINKENRCCSHVKGLISLVLFWTPYS